MNDNRKKLLISILIFVTGLFADIYFSTALHLILSGKARIPTLTPAAKCIQSIASDEAHRMLFLYIQGFILLLAVFFYVSNNKPYQSKLREITPQIKTPVPVGQKQHGSAEWLTNSEKDTVFDSYYLKPKDRLTKELIKHGYEDKKSGMKGGDMKKRTRDSKIAGDDGYTERFISRGGVVIGMKKQGNTRRGCPYPVHRRDPLGQNKDCGAANSRDSGSCG